MNNRLHTLFTGRHVTILETVNSTSNYMDNILAEKILPEGAVIVAREQTEGRGQTNTQWLSEAGKNLLMTFVFYPSFLNTQNLFLLSKAFSLGINDGIKKLLNAEVKIKWPNDIYVADKKICGMLIENAVRNPNINHSLLGVGMNVNQEDFSRKIPNPVSLKMILGKESDLDDCFCILCNALESRYLQLKSGNTDQLNEDYLSALYRFGEFHEYENNNEKFKAKITAIADDGKIFLKRENGLIEKYDFKEVKFTI